MKTNLYLKLLLFLFAGMMVFGFASCKDDELAPDIDEQGISIPLPTEDEVKTTVNKSYAVIGTDFDEVTPYVMKRMTGQRYDYTPADTYIADDVEVVFMDTKALTGMHKEMAYELKEVYDRDGAIYMHKPNALALAFFQMLVNDELDDFMEWMEENTGSGAETRTDQDGNPLTRDCYLISRNRNLDVADIYNGKPVTAQVIITDSLPDGTVQTRTEEQTFTPGEPTAYEYGRFAERIAAWINEGGEPATRTVPDNNRHLDQVEFTQLVPCRLQRDGDGKILTTQAELKAWASCLYNFDAQQDYYHVVLQQSYPGKDFFNEQYYHKNEFLSKKTYCAGYTYGGFDIHATLDCDEYPIVSRWNPRSNTAYQDYPAYQQVDGWSGYVSTNDADGYFLHCNAYTHNQVVTKPKYGLYTKLTEIADSGYVWNGFINPSLHYKMEYVKEPWISSVQEYRLKGVPSESDFVRNTCTTVQSFNCLVGNTRNRTNNPFTLNVKAAFYANGAYAYSHRNGYNTENRRVKVYDGTVSFSLPVPHRYHEPYKITCDEEIAADEWATIEKVMETRAPSYKLVAGNVTHYTKQKLDEEIGKRWNAFKSEMQGKLIDITGNYTLRLRDREGEEIGTPLYLGPTGGVTYEIGSYYMRDGSFLPPDTKPNHIKQTEVVGVVCRLADDWSKPGLRGYVISANDVDFNLHPWGDTFYQPEGSEGDSIPIDTYLSQEWGEHNTIEIFNAARIGGKEPSDKWYPLLKQLKYFRKRNATPEGSRDWFIPTTTELADAIDAISDRTMQRAGGRAFRKDGSVYASSSTSPSEKDIVYGSFWNEKGFWQHGVKTDSQKKQFLLRPFLAF